MEDRAFDQLTRLVAAPGSRRNHLRAALGVFAVSRLPVEAEAAKRRSRKKKKKKGKPPANPTCNPPCADGEHCCATNDCRECCGNADCDGGETCEGGQCVGGCDPQCQDRECGPDQCGSTCGDCDPSEDCDNQTGQCVCRKECAGKECGPDGCGGACNPGCSGSEPVCTEAGQCVQCVAASDCPDPGQCRVKSCTTGNACVPEVAQNSTNPRGACPNNQVCCEGGCTGCCKDGDCAGTQVCCGGTCKGCCNVDDCRPLDGGTVDCSQGFCIRRCANNQFLICNSTSGSGPDTCQECCKNDDCRFRDPDATCVNGTCRCPAGKELCDNTCVTIGPNNCGQCDHENCAGGSCNDDGTCQDPVLCGGRICPKPDVCEPEVGVCEPNKVCTGLQARICDCPPGLVDCDGDGDCESCGRCNLGPCPSDPVTGLAGACCPDGSCTCGGVCCNGGMCYVSASRTGEGSLREQCVPADSCVECRGQCCGGCINGECVHTTPISGGSIRRR